MGRRLRVSPQRSPLTRCGVLPSGVNRPWAESNRYKISELLPFTVAWPHTIRSSSLSFCVRFNRPLRRSPYKPAATLDTGRVAIAYPRGSHTRSSITPCQSARACDCYSVITALSSNLPTAIGPNGSVGNTAAVARSMLGLSTSAASHSQRQDRIHIPYLSFWKTRGSIAAAPTMPPESAPAIPGLITSWPARNRPGTGVRALSASVNMRRGVVSTP